MAGVGGLVISRFFLRDLSPIMRQIDQYRKICLISHAIMRQIIIFLMNYPIIALFLRQIDIF